ncbi:hypothetical protein V5799_000187 [Amblyomma americanum]|uniref:Uncharacterized protein n=1 Tax=Amblyomma americanum TaxID=6943 RepID=A0AAQ4D3S1_AMBAM
MAPRGGKTNANRISSKEASEAFLPAPNKGSKKPKALRCGVEVNFLRNTISKKGERNNFLKAVHSRHAGGKVHRNI